MMRREKARQSNVKRDNFEDKGKGTIMEGYTTHQEFKKTLVLG